LCLREFPGAVQDLGPRLVEADHVVLASFDRQAIGDLAVAAAELDINRAVGPFPQNLHPTKGGGFRTSAKRASAPGGSGPRKKRDVT
jgi:hypothetical protein